MVQVLVWKHVLSWDLEVLMDGADLTDTGPGSAATSVPKVSVRKHE